MNEELVLELAKAMNDGLKKFSGKDMDFTRIYSALLTVALASTGIELVDPLSAEKAEAEYYSRLNNEVVR